MGDEHVALFDLVEDVVARKDLATLDFMANAYFEEADAGPKPFSAAIQLTPQGRAALAPESRSLPPLAESALMLDAANYIERARRYLRYRSKIESDPSSIRIVAEGDSWFQYPFLKHDMIDVLMERYAVNCLSAGGDTVANMIRQSEYIDAIAREKPRAFVFSGGGNDLVGDGKLRTMLRDFRAGASARDLVDWDQFQSVLTDVLSGFSGIATRLEREFPALPMLTHAYDRPENIAKGPWIKPFMDERGIPLDIGKTIIGLMLDEFGNGLSKLTQQHANLILVSVSGTVGRNVSDWYDALHPQDPGFRRAANKLVARIDHLLGAPAPRELRRTLNVSRSFAELMPSPHGVALTQAIDFSLADHINSIVDGNFGPEDQWIKFDDPEVVRHIRDVIQLLGKKDEPETPERIDHRLRSGASSLPGNAFPTAQTYQGLAEAIIGTSNDLEDVQTLIVGYQAAKAIGLVKITSSTGAEKPQGTGYLVAPGILLTNHHVLPNANLASRAVLVMDDETSLLGDPLPIQRYKVTSELYVADPHLDFVFASVEPVSKSGKSLDSYGHFDLDPISGKVIKGEPVVIVQHPDGRPKAVALRNSFAMGRVEEGFYYTADTLPGSSGSAVLNVQWQVVALHHRTVPHPTIPGRYLANRGVRISSILQLVSEMSRAGHQQASQLMGHLGLSADSIVGTAAELPLHTPDVETLRPSSERVGSQDTDSDDNCVGLADEETEDLLTRRYSAPEGDEQSQLVPPVALTEATRPPRLTYSDVRWVLTFSNNPDYWHLPASAQGARFSVGPEHIEALIESGHYEPYFTPEGLLIVAVRGSGLSSGQEVVTDQSAISMLEQGLDHRTFRCTILVYDRQFRRLSAFKASTVPNRGGVASQFNLYHGYGGDNANMLPTGCYELCVGTHEGSTTVPNVLRLGTGPTISEALRVTTLRTLNDGVYGIADAWDNCVPKDNIHPAFSASSADFSSLGCLTIPGAVSNGQHTGNWKRFREVAKFSGSNARGKRYNLLLTTGMELAAVSTALGDPAARRRLARLSHGSTGEQVRALQAQIGNPVTGTFDASTKEAWTKVERGKLQGSATGIYSYRSEQLFQYGIL